VFPTIWRKKHALAFRSSASTIMFYLSKNTSNWKKLLK